METINVNVKRISDQFNDIELPEYTTEGSAGLDIRAAVDEPIILESGKVVLVPTNLSVEIPLGYEIQVRPRSGLAAKYGIGVMNSPGTIDSDYRGEVKIILFNFGKEDFTINRGERVAQMVISKVYRMDLNLRESLSDSERGTGGFGHTGTK